MADRILEGYVHEDEYLAELKRSKRWARLQRQLGLADPYVKCGADVYYSVEGARKRMADREQKPVRARRTA
jgi:hypothetical protein